MNIEQEVAAIMPILMDKGFMREDKAKYIKELCRRVAKHARSTGIRNGNYQNEEEYLKEIGYKTEE